MTIERWYRKSQAYAEGWKSIFGVYPSRENTILGLSVAQHETLCGDAWPGENNYGAIQKRGPTAAERAILGPASFAAVHAGQAALAAAIAAGEIPPLDHEALHVDSSPVTGPYWRFFWAFPTEAEGAAKFVHVLAENRESCRVVLEGASSTNGPVSTRAEIAAPRLAAAMYATHYFEGIHDPHVPGGIAANISDYANALLRILPEIQQALATWTPGAQPPAPPPAVDCDLCTIRGVQHAINLLGIATTIGEDGVAGPQTKAAIMYTQQMLGLTADGKCGPKTRAAIGAALVELGKTFASACSGVVP